ncbi:MAG TPA: SMP-30/gluconolactonase/LRE family protein [Phycisphaerae bacterium]|nr:SMP-30/gluconolactonase/LRE family protein [Phycisphaerae bacterium]HOJ75040.1 SMP-30/gluconolactonase/LRE family protein [Phycisphaerae bacterium]
MAHIRTTWTVLTGLCLAATAQAAQPKVSPGPNEPDWSDILAQQWNLDMERDLRNPLHDGAVPAHLFVRAGRGKVTFTPIIALGLEEKTNGGWYRMRDGKPEIHEAWRYAYKQPEAEMKSGQFTPPKLDLGRVEIEPGDEPFGLWVSNDAFKDERVFTDPRLVAATNARLKDQPYKAMIYPTVDPKTGQPVPNSYIIGWEYSTNDDFQDVVTRIDNVRLLPASKLPGITQGEPVAKKIAGGFKFTEGPAWNFKDSSLYFSDIPNADIVRYQDGQTRVVNDQSGESNGLMFDKPGALIACEHAGRRVSRAATPGQPGQTIVDRYQGKRLNSPNDLWIDTAGGIYFTDPRYGNRDNMEMKEEAVYYVTADGQISRIIDDLVRPNGIALSPDGKTLYVVDNGTSLLYRYPVLGPGKLGKGERIAYTPGPDGMSVDEKGRLYVTGIEGTLVLEPDGKWIGVIASAEPPSNCTFGGKDYRTLFITARTGLYAIETQTRGWHVHLDGEAPASGQ